MTDLAEVSQSIRIGLEYLFEHWRQMTMRFDPDELTIASVEFIERDILKPGWYVRYLVLDGEERRRLKVERGADAFCAVEAAAALLRCRPQQIEVRGPVWPDPLHGTVRSDETMEFVSDRGSGLVGGDGRWKRLDS